MNIREIDTADWEASERAEALTLPYEVLSSPYGDTISERYATYDAAEAAYRASVALTGEYMTSWGMVPVNTEVTVFHYVNNAPEVVEVDACVDCSQAVSGISAHERGAEYPEAVTKAIEAYGMRLANGDCGDENENCISFTWSPCELCGSPLGGERHRVAILPA